MFYYTFTHKLSLQGANNEKRNEYYGSKRHLQWWFLSNWNFIYKVEGKVYEKDDCEVIDDCVDENLESKLTLLQKALENNEVITNSLEKQLDKELKNI